jgi:dihydroorotate dehydrogenase electron transfer subunit
LSRYFKAKITNNLPLNSKNRLLSIKPLEPIINPEPGQFYMIEVGNSYDPLLKRPFSYFRKTSESIQFLYTVRGKGTSLMKDFKQGQVINIIGPLGIGYPKPEDDCTPLLVAGGIGIASIFSFAEKLEKKAYMLYGAKCKDELLIMNELKSLAKESIICTDDGSTGKKSTVVDVLNEFLTSTSLPPTSYLIYACGPKPMLEAISKIAINNGIKGFVSLEENMACGFGACLGCAVKVKSQKSNPSLPPFSKVGTTCNRGGRGGITKSEFIYKRVCKEGPVFPIEEIVW